MKPPGAAQRYRIGVGTTNIVTVLRIASVDRFTI
jgi:hypothetical protein